MRSSGESTSTTTTGGVVTIRVSVFEAEQTQTSGIRKRWLLTRTRTFGKTSICHLSPCPTNHISTSRSISECLISPTFLSCSSPFTYSTSALYTDLRYSSTLTCVVAIAPSVPQSYAGSTIAASGFPSEPVRALEHLPQSRPLQVLAQMRHLLFEPQYHVFDVLAVGQRD